VVVEFDQARVDRAMRIDPLRSLKTGRRWIGGVEDVGDRIALNVDGAASIVTTRPMRTKGSVPLAMGGKGHPSSAS